MENHGVLSWRKCSPVYIAQMVGGGCCGFLTLLIPGLLAWSSKLGQYNPLAWILVVAAGMLGAPTRRLCDALGLPITGTWWWFLFVVLVNTLLGALFGTVLGLIIKALQRATK